MEDKIRVQVQFTKTTDEGIDYTDCLYYDLVEYPNVKQEDIETAKQERFDNWQTLIENPPVIEEVPIDDQIASIDSQIKDLTDRKVELESLKAEAKKPKEI